MNLYHDAQLPYEPAPVAYTLEQRNNVLFRMLSELYVECSMENGQISFPVHHSDSDEYLINHISELVYGRFPISQDTPSAQHRPHGNIAE